MAAKFACLFGVEQADIDQMNQGGCPSGSSFSAPVASIFNRDQPFLMKTLNVLRYPPLSLSCDSCRPRGRYNRGNRLLGCRSPAG
jgi:hypothetical protein